MRVPLTWGSPTQGASAHFFSSSALVSGIVRLPEMAPRPLVVGAPQTCGLVVRRPALGKIFENLCIIVVQTGTPYKGYCMKSYPYLYKHIYAKYMGKNMPTRPIMMCTQFDMEGV